ncbi:MAG TPA: enoyl-CoA hydratase-related protein [Mycobacteriales bacterium]|nr:enoyl-CoA hydratase-related protein [Mycobacteriales bacterium]
MSVVRYEVAGGVATITLNRPDALNALSVALKVELLEAVERAGADDAVRAVLLTGAGRGFCVGQDLREHVAALDAGDTELSTVSEHYNPLIQAIAELPKPVVAAVNGPAAGAGASLAFACDIRVAADDASFLMAFARVGLGPDSGASWTLPRLIGPGRAAAMLMLAEPVAAAQALEMGLVSMVVPAPDLMTVAAELAGRLAAGPTAAYHAIKQTLAYAAAHSLEESLANEARAQARCGQTDDHRAAVTAFLEKRSASFSGR